MRIRSISTWNSISEMNRLLNTMSFPKIMQKKFWKRIFSEDNFKILSSMLKNTLMQMNFWNRFGMKSTNLSKKSTWISVTSTNSKNFLFSTKDNHSEIISTSTEIQKNKFHINFKNKSWINQSKIIPPINYQNIFINFLSNTRITHAFVVIQKVILHPTFFQDYTNTSTGKKYFLPFKSSLFTRKKWNLSMKIWQKKLT